jgi:hypothetical protein
MLIRECAPLCLAQDPGWGGVSRGWAWIGAATTMWVPTGGVKMFRQRPSRALTSPDQARAPPVTSPWLSGNA